jgi:hypothetical protein
MIAGMGTGSRWQMRCLAVLALLQTHEDGKPSGVDELLADITNLEQLALMYGIGSVVGTRPQSAPWNEIPYGLLRANMPHVGGFVSIPRT